MKLIFLFGLPGVGKLTVAQELEVFHNHLTVDLVTSLFEFGSQSFIELREKIWLETFSQALKAKLSGLIFTFAPERTVPDDFPEKVRSLIETNGGKVFFVELKCSQTELAKRISDPSRTKFGKLNSIELFHQLTAQGVFNTPQILPDLIIENDKLSASETAQLIVNKIDLS